jgi:hypothetical protein
MNSLNDLTKAYEFAAQKHTYQRRKGVRDIPYIKSSYRGGKLTGTYHSKT